MRSSRLFMAALACASLLGPAAGFAQTAGGSNKPTTTPGITAPPASGPTTAIPTATPGATMAMPGTTSMVNINTASASDLDKLPQIGKARSARIIAGRPYKSTDELLTRKVLSKSVFDKIKTMVTTG